MQEELPRHDELRKDPVENESMQDIAGLEERVAGKKGRFSAGVFECEASRPFLPFSNHLVFRRVMRDPETARTFLERVLHLKIERVVYCNTEQVVDMSLEAKSVRLDLYVRDSDRVYNVEMQSQDYADIGQRMAYYQSAINADAIGRGCSEYDLPASFIVFLCKDDPFGFGHPVYMFRMSCEEQLGFALETGSTWLALNAQAYDREPDEGVRNVLSYVCERTIPEGDALIERIDAEVRSINHDGKQVDELMRYMTIEEHCLAMGRKSGRKEGFEEGLAEGLAAGEVRGESRLSSLVSQLLRSDRLDDIARVTDDPAYRERLFKEFGIA